MSFYSSKMVKQPTKKKSPLGIILLIVLLLISGVAYYVSTLPAFETKINLYRCYWDSNSTNSKFGTEEKKPVTIEQGQNILEIGNTLKNAGLIDNPEDFACYVGKINAGEDIQAGYYEIAGNISIEQLIPQLKYADVPSFSITIPEGLRMDEIGRILDTKFSSDNPINEFSYNEFIMLTKDEKFLSKRAYLKGQESIEGFLFPDTYQFAKDASTEEVINVLLDTFEKKVEDLKLLEIKDPYSVMVLASIIEKEAGRSYEEKQMISDILQKRLEADYLLEVDATFLYEKKNWKAPIYAADKLSKSKYNTYLYAGLPPTPICNPGYDSISAVLNRKTNNYWFYLHGTDGKIRYGVTYEDHLQNIDMYLR